MECMGDGFLNFQGISDFISIDTVFDTQAEKNVVAYQTYN